MFRLRLRFRLGFRLWLRLRFGLGFRFGDVKILLRFGHTFDDGLFGALFLAILGDNPAYGRKDLLHGRFLLGIRVSQVFNL